MANISNKINNLISGKNIKRFYNNNEEDDVLTFEFTDNTALKIRVDYIYDYEYNGKEVK